MLGTFWRHGRGSSLLSRDAASTGKTAVSVTRLACLLHVTPEPQAHSHASQMHHPRASMHISHAHRPHASLTPHTHTAHTSNTHAHTHTTSSRRRGELGGREQLPRDPAGQLLGPPPTDTESEPRRAGMTCPRSQSMLVAELPRFLKNQVQPVGGRRAQSSARFPSQFTPLLGGRSIEEGHSSMTPSLSAALNLCLLP